jgi:hypothetical protein
MATIITFYKPQSFQEGSRAAPREEFGKIIQFPGSHIEEGGTADFDPAVPARSSLVKVEKKRERSATKQTQSIGSFRVERLKADDRKQLLAATGKNTYLCHLRSL